MSFGQNLKHFRNLRGISQIKLGTMLSSPVSEKTISSWEVDRTQPNMDVVIELSQILHTTLDELIRGDNMDKSHEMIPFNKNTLINLIIEKNMDCNQIDLITSMIMSWNTDDS